MRNSSAFTLVEILLVTTLIAGISLAVFKCLSNGLRLWDRSRVLMVEDDVALFFDHFVSDMRNSFPLSTLSFEGSEYRISFPSVVMAKTDSAGSRASEGFADGLGRVQYFFDVANQAMIRRQANYGQALHGVWGDERRMIKGITRVRFKYLLSGSNDYSLIQEAGDPFPSGVEVEVSLMSGDEEKILKRFVAIPVGL